MSAVGQARLILKYPIPLLQTYTAPNTYHILVGVFCGSISCYVKVRAHGKGREIKLRGGTAYIDKIAGNQPRFRTSLLFQLIFRKKSVKGRLVSFMKSTGAPPST